MASQQPIAKSSKKKPSRRQVLAKAKKTGSVKPAEHDRNPKVVINHESIAIPPRASGNTCRTMAKIIMQHCYWYANSILDKDFDRSQREIELIAKYAMMYRQFAGNPLADWTPPPVKVTVKERKERGADTDDE